MSSLPPQLVAQKIAILPQQQIVPAGLTVEQLVSLGRTPHQPWSQWELNAEDKEQVANAIQETQLESFRHRPVEQGVAYLRDESTKYRYFSILQVMK